MEALVFSPEAGAEFKLAIVVPEPAFDVDEIQRHYVTKLEQYLDAKDIIALSVPIKDLNMTTARAEFTKLCKALDIVKVTHLLITQPLYFKAATGLVKVTNAKGYTFPSKIGDYTCAVATNYKALFHNPSAVQDIDLGIQAIGEHIKGIPTSIGTDVIHSARYYTSYEDIVVALDELLQYEALTVDIEAFSLDYWDAGIATIAFAWDQHNGICITCDWDNNPFMFEDGTYGGYLPNKPIRTLLAKFFSEYTGTAIYHNASYDIKVILYTLFMEHLSDYKGLVNGLHILTESIQDTKIITYLATNTTAGNKLSLKHTAYEFVGDYAEDVTDIRKLSRNDLMEYNLKDCLATWYTYNKHMPTLLADNQLEVYSEVFLPSIKPLINTELNGLCVDMPEIIKLEKETKLFIDGLHEILADSKVVHTFLEYMHEDMAVKACAKLKTKFRFIEDFADVPFNPNSGPQKAMFLHDFLGIPVTDKTKKGQPATGTDALIAIKHALMIEHGITKEDLLC